MRPGLLPTPLLTLSLSWALLLSAGQVVDFYPVDPRSPVALTQFVSLAWLLPDAPATRSSTSSGAASGAPGGSEERLALSVLNHLLLGTASAPLEKALVASGLGASVTGGGFSSALQQVHRLSVAATSTHGGGHAYYFSYWQHLAGVSRRPPFLWASRVWL